MGHLHSHADYAEAAEYILKRTQYRPTVGLILGSGLGPLAESIEAADIFPYREIPHWPQSISKIEGHKHQLVVGQLEAKTVLTFQGRLHYYEGYTLEEVTFSIHVMQALNIKTLIVTNAAGGINKSFATGDLMLITDHINLMGANPLIGPNDDELGQRFPNMVYAYDLKLCNLAKDVAGKQGLTLREGVYIGVTGPSFETPAEIRMMRTLGADAVGMSTVPEVIVARHAGIRVLGISGIANIAIDVPQPGLETNHGEVLMAGLSLAPRLEKLLRGVLAALDE